VGPQFNDLHKFFAEQYEAIDDFVDDVAARARTSSYTPYFARFSPRATRRSTPTENTSPGFIGDGDGRSSWSPAAEAPEYVRRSMTPTGLPSR